MDLSTLANVEPALVRAGLAPWISQHLDEPESVQQAVAAKLQAVVNAATDAEILAMRQAFREVGEGWRLFPANPLAQAITRAFMAAISQPFSLHGREHIAAFLATKGRKLVVCNHLSYTDTQATDALLAVAGLAEFANRLVAIAGPKVYTEPWRRLASVALNTRKTPQSSAVASEQDSMSPRELAVVALETVRDCERLMDEGYIVLLYPEGTRSRDTKLQPFLRAASRYLAIEGLQVLPFAQTGGERLFPVDSDRMYCGEVRLAFGEPFATADFPGKTGALDEAYRRVRSILPAAYQ